MERVLVTGLSGLIGGLLRPALAARYRLRALNRSPVPGVETVQADINDGAAIAPAFADVAVVVHLAAALGADVKQLLTTNVNGTYQVFEAARAAGVRRVVYASSGATVGGYEADEPFRAMVEGRWGDVPEPPPVVTHADPVRPSGVYGVTKVFGEALARHYADAYGISMLCLRIGAVLPADRPQDSRQAAVFLSHRDAVQAIVRCLEAPPEVRFAVMFAVSDNPRPLPRRGLHPAHHRLRAAGRQPRPGAVTAAPVPSQEDLREAGGVIGPIGIVCFRPPIRCRCARRAGIDRA